jgi:hypothetical protein
MVENISVLTCSLRRIEGEQARRRIRHGPSERFKHQVTTKSGQGMSHSQREALSYLMRLSTSQTIDCLVMGDQELYQTAFEKSTTQAFQLVHALMPPLNRKRQEMKTKR